MCLYESPCAHRQVPGRHTLAQGRRVTICQIMPVCSLSGSDEFPQLHILTNTSSLLISLVHMLQIPSPRLTLVFGVGACPLSFHFNVVKYIFYW